MNTPDPESALSKPLEAGLYIVATPIGNLGDVTVRAVDVLRRCEVIACEDTRVTGKLLKHCGVNTRMMRYDDHASDRQREGILDLARSQPVALVSDAGTPLISDPGYRLVRDAREAGVTVTSLPGACAAITGLTLAGLPNDRFLFAGFLPVKEKARGDVLSELANVAATLIFYETGPRLERSLKTIAEIWPTREVAVARELTKMHEECRTGTASDVATYYAAHPPKGEIVLLIGPPDVSISTADPDALLREALQEVSPSKAAAKVSKATGIDRQTLYTRAVELKSQ
ncbi:16S rRNA (cytidine(1402)-2'-O)-methyltransferase [Erythrobacter crassostreae]|uniref:Ribosomal RNA small subunit methyltransferase I n=1 Tax=Erythrobacter crassostreae TaxID=2828328 RepID=A0A9X1F4I2_9SPHN|nr:16S rRNA (cytidine(1402)-2'-O)-methyltransferase [Erythrobacter crassostrea]MBV7259982.1 16S rRNA (cytidine(1402)-2'-O)-methyltransferase [Erythrobacter crassostrea]